MKTGPWTQYTKEYIPYCEKPFCLKSRQQTEGLQVLLYVWLSVMSLYFASGSAAPVLGTSVYMENPLRLKQFFLYFLFKKFSFKTFVVIYFSDHASKTLWSK